MWLLVVLQGNSWLDQPNESLFIHAVQSIVILHLIWQIIDHRCPEFFGIPYVRKVLRNEKIILVDGAPWLGTGVMTTLYIVADDVELFLSLGEVTNVQHNNLVQISLRSNAGSHEVCDRVWETLERTDKKAVLVKPANYQGRV